MSLKISVITVCFNAASTIVDTLASVAGQSHSDLEHIVIDGASTDGTHQIVRELGHRVTVLVSEPDGGIYDAMNRGLARATGDVIAFLNADDVYADRSVLARVSREIGNRDLDALFGDIATFRSDHPGTVVRRYRSDRFSPTRIAWGLMPAHPALFVRRAVYQRFGVFRTDFRIAGDYEFVARIFKDETLRYEYIPEVLVRMRIGGVSTGGWRNTLLLNEEVLRACRLNGIDTNLFKILSKYPYKLAEFVRR